MTRSSSTGGGLEIAWFVRRMSFRQRIASFIATAGGAGHSPVAPGTAGSLVAALLFFVFGSSSWTVQLLLIGLVLGIGLWAAGETERFSGVHDDRRIVIDEVVGVWIALFAFPPTIPTVAAGFLLFRALDIYKPFPADWIDKRWKGARSVLFDDVAAGIYAQILLRLGMRIAGLL
jgi:phosphatidylglycerophosphatase A